MAAVARESILALYRAVLRKSRTFKLTDSVWYRQRVRQEFVTHRGEADHERVKILYQRGLAFRDGSEIL